MAADIPAIDVKRASFKYFLSDIILFFLSLYITIGWIIFSTSEYIALTVIKVLNCLRVKIISFVVIFLFNFFYYFKLKSKFFSNLF